MPLPYVEPDDMYFEPTEQRQNKANLSASKMVGLSVDEATASANAETDKLRVIAIL